MREVMVLAALALCLFCLVALARRDVVRLLRPVRRVTARVVGVRTTSDIDGKDYAPVYEFTDESGRHEVVDQVYSPRNSVAAGTLVELTYPEGRPDLARPSRPLLWLWVYSALLAMLAILTGVATGTL